MNIVKLNTAKIINIFKLSQNSFLSLTSCIFFYILTVLHKPYWFQNILLFLLEIWWCHVETSFCFHKIHLLKYSFSQYLLYSSLIDWFAAGQCFSSNLRVSILHNKNLLAIPFGKNLPREVLYYFFFGEDVISVTGIL